LRSSDTKPRERLLFSPLEDEPAIENLPEPIALTANYQQFARRSRDRAAAVAVRDRAQFELHLQGQGGRRKAGGARVGRALCARRKRAEGRQPGADYGPADRYGDRLPYLGRPVASSVVGAIEPRLRFAEIERARRKPTESLGAYDLYLCALAEFYKVTLEGNQEALRLFHRALALDGSYAPAAAMAASSLGRAGIPRLGAGFGGRGRGSRRPGENGHRAWQR